MTMINGLWNGVYHDIQLMKSYAYSWCIKYLRFIIILYAVTIVHFNILVLCIALLYIWYLYRVIVQNISDNNELYFHYNVMIGKDGKKQVEKWIVELQ